VDVDVDLTGQHGPRRERSRRGRAERAGAAAAGPATSAQKSCARSWKVNENSYAEKTASSCSSILCQEKAFQDDADRRHPDVLPHVTA